MGHAIPRVSGAVVHIGLYKAVYLHVPMIGLVFDAVGASAGVNVAARNPNVNDIVQVAKEGYLLSAHVRDVMSKSFKRLIFSSCMTHL